MGVRRTWRTRRTWRPGSADGRGRYPVAPALAAALLPLGLTACGMFGGGAGGATQVPDDAPEKSRARVQAYLDAMRTKDVAAGREQLCAAMRDGFDAAATGPNGDFAGHFTVPEATVTDVRTNGDRQEVSASVSVSVSGKTSAVRMLFTVARTGESWCIADEKVGGNGSPSGAPASSAGS